MIKAEWTNKDSLDLQPTCNQLATTEGDLINRADAINCIKWGEGVTDVIERIESLPSADRPTGHWVEIEDYNGDIHYQCDQCGEEFILIDGTPEDNNYWHCPNCGSYNGGGEAVVKGADNESTL